MIDQHHTDNILSRPEVQNMKNDINSLKANGSELMKEIKQESAEIVRDELSRLKKSGKEKILLAEEHVRSKPGQSVALGLAAGLVLSYILARRR